MIAAMLMMVLAVFPAGTGLIVSRCFALTMERERARALSEETAIARAMAMEIGSGSAQALYAAASGAQKRYGSRSLSVTLVRHGQPMAGAVLPETEEMDALLSTDARATLLDGERQTLFIAHAMDNGVTLLLGSDVSPVYALRSTLTRWAAMLCAAGMALAALLALGISGILMRPVRALSRAAQALQGGDYDAPLPRAGGDEIGALTRAFADMTLAIGEREAALREQAERRQELIDAMAHEMRTPLTAIVGGSRLLQRASLPEEEREALLETMAREAQRLSQMDERLLLLTRLAHGEPEWTDFSSMEMAREALAIFENVVLAGEDTVWHGERELTIELLRNLVVNAQRAGGETPVTVTVRRDGFDVADRGCGMTPEQIGRAFEPFYRADKSRARAAGGAGLGLTLCQRIAQLHGGTLTIHSTPGEGTTVVYRFVTTP